MSGLQRCGALYQPLCHPSTSTPCHLPPLHVHPTRRQKPHTLAQQGRSRHLLIVAAAQGALPLISPAPDGKAAKKPDLPLQQRVLNGILGVSNVPYSSFVPSPVSPLHRVDARIKQLWLVSLYLLVARATPIIRVCIAATVATATIANFPPRLWQAQLKRLGLFCALIFVMTAVGSDGIPPVLQPRAPPPGLENLPSIPATAYKYVLLHIGPITVTHRSVNLAITAASLTFSALQTASLCLITTPGEEMALALRWWLAPLRFLRVPVQEIALTLLLSLRFMSLVFEEVRNLTLGLASRGVNWKMQGYNGSMEICGRLCSRLFGNLFNRSENIAQAMMVRGFKGPEGHNFYMMKVNETTVLANCLAVLVLVGYSVLIYLYK